MTTRLNPRDATLERLTTRAIAEKLGVSVKTVEAHRENIKGKLRLDTHTALVARAAQWLRESGQG